MIELIAPALRQFPVNLSIKLECFEEIPQGQREINNMQKKKSGLNYSFTELIRTYKNLNR